MIRVNNLDYYSTAEAAEVIGLSKQSVFIKKYYFETIKIGHDIFFLKNDVDEYAMHYKYLQNVHAKNPYYKKNNN